MSIVVNVNGESINYPQTGDTNWGDEATDFAVQTSSAFAKVGLSTGTTVDLPGTLDVTGATTLDSTLTVAGTTTLNGTANLTGIVNVDSGVLYVDPTNNRVGINDTTPSKELDVTGEIQSSSHITCNGVVYADDSTTANTPVISFTGDTNTGIGRSAADTLDLITGGNSRFRIESTGQIKAVYESQVGTDYNTQLDNGYLCRAWANFNGGTVVNPASQTGIRASGNVSTILDNAIGDYTVNMTVALPDINYSIVCGVSTASSNPPAVININRVLSTGAEQAPTTSSFRLNVQTPGGSAQDPIYVNVGIFR